MTLIRRDIVIHDKKVMRTPLLVPSFSSKGFPDIKGALAATGNMLTDAALVSAYDMQHHGVRTTGNGLGALGVMFVDSGGYELSKDDDFARLARVSKPTNEWSRALHLEALTLLRRTQKGATVLVSYDSPHERQSYVGQIKAADALFSAFPGFGHEILLKPPRKAPHLDVDAVSALARQLCAFDVVGVTEKDLGDSVFDRMKAIALLRRAINSFDDRKPLHIFGSLDTISTPLYFLAGADIFDGLTWLRYRYHDGLTTYANTATLRHTIKKSEQTLELQTAFDNLSYLTDLSDQLRRFLERSDFSCFKHHGEFFRSAADSLAEEVR